MPDGAPESTEHGAHARSGLILVTGATGFVGGRLTPRLLEQGYRVRCLVRDEKRLRARPWASQVEVVSGDIATCETLVQALEGVSTAFYLVHNMSKGKDYTEAELAAAENFADAADMAGVEHIIYLGGLADPSGPIGKHMLSRLKTGETLRRGAVPVTELRASLIIGVGSVSFEMIRFMSEQLPILAGPRWVHSRCQPISIRNVLDYLIGALEKPAEEARIYEIGGTDALRYSETMQVFAEVRGLKRPFWVLPFIPVSLMAFAVDMLTPVDYNLAYPLLAAMNGESVVTENSALRDFPEIERDSYREAVVSALGKLSPEYVETGLQPCESHVKIKRDGFFIDSRVLCVEAPAEALFEAISSLGGDAGWPYLNWLWKLRGWLDRRLGGPGMRGGRPGEELRVGEAVDFYWVDALTQGSRLRLKAELKAPGDGWMEWLAEARPGGGSTLRQLAFFAPKGAGGFLYWYALYPFHQVVFNGLAKSLKRRAETARLDQSTES